MVPGAPVLARSYLLQSTRARGLLCKISLAVAELSRQLRLMLLRGVRGSKPVARCLGLEPSWKALEANLIPDRSARAAGGCTLIDPEPPTDSPTRALRCRNSQRPRTRSSDRKATLSIHFRYPGLLRDYSHRRRDSNPHSRPILVVNPGVGQCPYHLDDAAYRELQATIA
jgi:hypothetical protein